jgi:hypothetical protein
MVMYVVIFLLLEAISRPLVARVLCWHSSVILRKNRAPVVELLTLRRSHLRPNHLHVMINAPEPHELTTALHPEGDPHPSSDVIFGAKKSLIGEYPPSTGRGLLRPCCQAHPQGVSTTLCLPFISFSLPWKGEFFSSIETR